MVAPTTPIPGGDSAWLPSGAVLLGPDGHMHRL